MLDDRTALSATIADIYDAAIDSAKWTAALKSTCAFVGAAQATMFWHGASASDVGVVHHYNNDPFYTRLFFEKLAPLNPMYPALLFQEVGAVHASSDLVPLREQRAMTFYKEWVAPQGIADALAVLLERDATRTAVLTLPCREGAIDGAARQRFALLVPHIQRAVAIGRLFAQERADNVVLTETLDRVGEAVFLLDAERRIVFANAEARQMIDRGALLQLRRDRLHAVSEEAERTLRAGLGVIEHDAPASAEGTTFALEDAADGRVIAHLLPLADGARRQVGRAHRASAALYVRRAHLADPTPLETLAKRHRLTASEIRVVEATLRLSGLDAIAEAVGVSRATVKTHLNRIYRKCAVRNQSGLIQLVAGLGRH